MFGPRGLEAMNNLNDGLTSLAQKKVRRNVDWMYS